MCIRRARLLYNIENISLEDLILYLRRLVRVYAILTILSIIEVASSYGNVSRIEFTLSVIALILYIINVLMIKLASDSPTLSNSKFPMASATVLMVYNIIQIIVLVTMFENWFALISLISVFIQCTTIFILFKLREKIYKRDNGMDVDHIEAPISPGGSDNVAVAVAVPVGNPMKR